MDSIFSRLRIATEHDIAALERLVHLAYRGGKSKVAWKNEHDLVDGPRITVDELTQAIGCKANHILILEDKQSAEAPLLGCIKVMQQPDNYAYLGMLAVHPSMQDQGLGRQLVSAGEQYAIEELGCSSIRMSVLSARQDLLAWYKRLGYEETGETEPFFAPESGQSATYDGAHFIVITKQHTV